MLLDGQKGADVSGSVASGSSFHRQIDRRARNKQQVCTMNLKWGFDAKELLDISIFLVKELQFVQ